MVQLLGSLTTTSQLLYLRVPALNALFPDYRTSVLDALGSVMHDNGLWATGDIYPRYACDYGTPRRPPSSADYPEPFMYTYCRDDHPGCWFAAQRTPRVRRATTPPVRRQGQTSVGRPIRPRRAGTRFRRPMAARLCRSSHPADRPTPSCRGDEYDRDDR